MVITTEYNLILMTCQNIAPQVCRPGMLGAREDWDAVGERAQLLTLRGPEKPELLGYRDGLMSKIMHIHK